MDTAEKYLTEINNAGFKGFDGIGKFWVVTIPSEHSTLADIFFESDIFSMHLQFLGGLKVDEIDGIYKSKPKALKHAKNLMKSF